MHRNSKVGPWPNFVAGDELERKVELRVLGERRGFVERQKLGGTRRREGEGAQSGGIRLSSHRQPLGVVQPVRTCWRY